MADRTVLVRLDAVINPYVSKMAEATAVTRKATQAEKDMQKATVDLGRGMQRVGTGMTVGLTAPLILFGKHAADTAMTAQETANRVTVAFGAQEDAVHKWSEGSARSMGLARHEAEGSASTYRVMFQEMGLGAGKAFELSTSMVKLAADVGSFRDVDPTEMLTKFSAGIVGEYEPLRQLGIVLTDAAVRQEAVRMGLAESTDEVNTAGLVQARYSLILKQTSKDQGDYARTANSATNASRTARAAYEDAMAELGTHLLPLIAQGADIITAIAEAFTHLSPAGQTAILVFAGLTAVAGPAILVTGTLIRNLQTIATVAPLAATGLRTMTLAAGGVGLVLTVAAAAYMLFADSQDDAAASTDRMAAAFEALARGEGAAARAMVLRGLAEQAAPKQLKGYDDLLTVLQELGLTAAAVTDIMTTAQDGTAKNTAAIKAWDAALDKAVRTGKLTREEADALDRAVFGLGNDYATSAGAAADLEAANKDVGDSAAGAAMDVDELRKKLDELFEQEFSAASASDKFASDLADFVDSVRTARVAGDQWATSLDAGTETGRGNRDMLRGLVGDLFDYAGSAGASAAQTAAMREQLVGVLTQLGFSRQEAEQFTAVLSNLSGLQVVPKVDIDISGAESKISSLEKRWASSTVSQAARAWGGMGSSASAPAVAALPTGPGPKEQAELDRQRSERESATRDYLQAVKDAEEERKRLEEDLSRFLKAVYDHQREIEDNQFEFHVMSKDRYLEILQQRLNGLEEYSDAWVAVMRKIQEVKDETLEAQLDVIRAYDEGRQFQLGFYQLAGMRAVTNAALVPAMSSSSSVVNNTRTFAPVLNAYGSDAMQATATNNQKLRDLAASYG